MQRVCIGRAARSQFVWELKSRAGIHSTGGSSYELPGKIRCGVLGKRKQLHRAGSKGGFAVRQNQRQAPFAEHLFAHCRISLRGSRKYADVCCNIRKRRDTVCKQPVTVRDPQQRQRRAFRLLAKVLQSRLQKKVSREKARLKNRKRCGQRWQRAVGDDALYAAAERQQQGKVCFAVFIGIQHGGIEIRAAAHGNT